ncbi:MAG: DUF362 domain-containing protein [Desulfatibacillaceae bacterium]
MNLPDSKQSNTNNTVVVRECPDYDRDRIREMVAQGMDELGYSPRGRVFVKPNVVFASRNGAHGSTAYTDPVVLGAGIRALADAPGVSAVDVGEKTAVGYPTRLVFKYAGYPAEIRNAARDSGKPVRLLCLDEQRRDPVFVGGSVHDVVRISRPMARADSLVYMPKLKCHCVSTMTGAVKLNIGILCDDERSIRHDFLLDEKIVDLLHAGYPDFIVMDAVDVGVGNEAVPTPRRLGLLVMGTNPMAVDLVGARLLGYDITQVSYLARAAERGFTPASLEDVIITGDYSDVAGLDEAARRIQPYDDEYTRWQDIHKELERLKSPIRFIWGTTGHDGSRCRTGCVMGIKMFLGFLERYAGPEAFKNARPAVLCVGKTHEPVDAGGHPVFLLGSCCRADVRNASSVKHVDRCFTTAVDMTLAIGNQLGIPSPARDLGQMLPLAGSALVASVSKTVNLRYLQDTAWFFQKGLQKRI